MKTAVSSSVGLQRLSSPQPGAMVMATDVDSTDSGLSTGHELQPASLLLQGLQAALPSKLDTAQQISYKIILFGGTLLVPEINNMV